MCLIASYFTHQDDEYLAALEADREKELKAMAEAAAVREKERQREEESRQKLDAEKVILVIGVTFCFLDSFFHLL